MAIPNDELIQDELVKLLNNAEGKTLYCNVIYDELAKLFPDLTVIEKTRKYRESKSKWANRVQFARLHLVNEGLLLPADKINRRGYWKLSTEGENYARSLRSIKVSSDSSLIELNQIINTLEHSLSLQETFNFRDLIDGRERILTSIVQRRGQTNFRQSLLLAYEFKCAITDCEIKEVLEAAHIIPYLGPETNKIQNGILLRADIHTLFDLRLLSIDEEKFCILLSSKLENTEYAKYVGRVINLPKQMEFYPNKDALRKHRTESNL